ncbi:MAG: flagellar motor switch protein FliN [Alphaproteobacteria bacterium]|nr:flagellar motor switch protein FliN [Alphaproteobacteria bacterium]|tara:strand:+ start:35491 stop:35814 length:324 start_codon:yes stop_codon:yes gene_type:complete
MALPEIMPTDENILEQDEASSEGKVYRSIYNVPVNVVVSIGQKRLTVSEILDLRPDSVIALSARIEDPVSLTVDNRLIARGELIETDEGGLGVKITEISEDPDAKGT